MTPARTTWLILALGCLALSPAAGADTDTRKPARDDAPIRTTPFPDVPRDHWAYDAVEALRRRGILRGYPPAPRRAAPRETPRPQTGRRPAR